MSDQRKVRVGPPLCVCWFRQWLFLQNLQMKGHVLQFWLAHILYTSLLLNGQHTVAGFSIGR